MSEFCDLLSVSVSVSALTYKSLPPHSLFARSHLGQRWLADRWLTEQRRWRCLLRVLSGIAASMPTWQLGRGRGSKREQREAPSGQVLCADKPQTAMRPRDLRWAAEIAEIPE